MTTPGSHNDTYAESFHRDFFANFARGVPPEECSRNTEGHNTAQIGGFVVRSCAFLLHACRGAQPAVFSWTLECGHAMPSGMWEIQHAVSSSVRAKHLVCLVHKPWGRLPFSLIGSSALHLAPGCHMRLPTWWHTAAQADRRTIDIPTAWRHTVHLLWCLWCSTIAVVQHTGYVSARRTPRGALYSLCQQYQDATQTTSAQLLHACTCLCTALPQHAPNTCMLCRRCRQW
jgi:hypothetical protein